MLMSIAESVIYKFAFFLFGLFPKGTHIRHKQNQDADWFLTTKTVKKKKMPQMGVFPHWFAISDLK